MFGWMKKVAPLILFIGAILLTNSAFSGGVQYGGEIPWPLSNQHLMTTKNSQGLWEVTNSKQEKKLFNVEMTQEAGSNFEYIRVSELDKSFKVIAWGEGFFTKAPLPGKPESSFSNIIIGGELGGNDSHGRYITMYGNGKVKKTPYLLRMVEVDTQLGKVLGISVIQYASKKFDHMLGSRVMESPMSCVEDDKDNSLDCIFEL